MISEQELSYILYQLGETEKPYRAISPPLVRSTNFLFRTIDEYRQAILNEKDLSIYSRGNNPTVRLLEMKLAALQGTEDALVFGSGSAAIAAAVLSKVKAGDHVLTVASVYSWTHKLLFQWLARFGVTASTVQGDSVHHFEGHLQPNTSLLLLESPNSQHFNLQDVNALTQWAHHKGLAVVLDNSYGTVLNRKPVEFGVDLICHSATKFTSGHSDVVAGLVCGNAADIRSIFNGEYMTLGAILSPDNAWMMLRSLRTLPMRLQHANHTCEQLIAYLQQEPRIARVIWPFDPQHPQNALAREQLDVKVPMFSFQLNTDDPVRIERFCESLRIIQIAVSWGSYESLLMPMIAFPEGTGPRNQMRLSVGFEDANSLMDDIRQALDVAME